MLVGALQTNVTLDHVFRQPVVALMHAVDWLPTICAVAGLAGCNATGYTLDGIDESGPLFANASGGHDFVLYGQHDDVRQLRFFYN